jgi:lysozyme family protein
MSDFDRAFLIVVGVEGEFSDDPKDPGNWTGGKTGQGTLKGTRYGISAAAYPNEDIRNLTLDRAKVIYYLDYWQRIRGNDLAWPLNLALFDAAVQHGPTTAISLLQKAVGAKADGNLGPITLARVRALKPDEAAALLMRQRTRFYSQLDTWPKYGDGWINRLFRVAFAA